VHDDGRHRDSVYNFGTFTFESAWLVVDFLKGRLRYWLSVQGIRGTLAAYQYENRTVLAQELALTPAERTELAAALELNALPENRYYKYDYYQDNCSTRVRDAVDRVLGGRLAAQSQDPGSMTFRQHTLRLTADDLPIWFGLDVAMGHPIDRPVRRWDEMFLPEALAEGLRRATVVTNTGEAPLVRSERLLVAADRPAERTEPPRWTLAFGLAGVALGSLLVVLGTLAARRTWARRSLALLLGALGLGVGLLGLVIALLWGLTDHVVTYQNENLLQFGAWTLLLVPGAVGLARERSWGLRLTRTTLIVAAGASTLGALGKLTPWFWQQNGELVALMLPTWAGALAAVYSSQRARPDAGAGSRH
jgi:hypothetical protein